jgi:hypothetical protein
MIKVNQMELEAYNDHQDPANPKIELKRLLKNEREGFFHHIKRTMIIELK